MEVQRCVRRLIGAVTAAAVVVCTVLAAAATAQTPERGRLARIIAGGKAVSGRSCLPRGGPEACVVVAHDALTGAEVWRRRLIPGPGEPGDESWGGVPFEERTHVGAWMVPSYDPALDLVYLGTSVTSPAPKFILGGVDNQHLYHNSTLDRATGEFLWATPTVLQNVISGIDGVTGVVTENAEVTFTAVGQQVFACPTWKRRQGLGGGCLQPADQHDVHAPAQHLRPHDGDAAVPPRTRRRPSATSAAPSCTPSPTVTSSATMSLVATGGGLVFGGDVSGRFRAFDHETGEVLWEINLGSAVTGFPITYAVDGRQFVAVSTGSGGRRRTSRG